MRFSRIESIVVDIDTIEFAMVSILSNPPKYRYYRIGIDTFAIASTLGLKHKFYTGHKTGGKISFYRK